MATNSKGSCETVRRRIAGITDVCPCDKYHFHMALVQWIQGSIARIWIHLASAVGGKIEPYHE